MYHRSSVGNRRTVSAVPAPDDAPPLARHPAPVRSSMNSRQLAGRLSGFGLIARQIARFTWAETCGASSFGWGKSPFTFFIQHSSGVVLANGMVPVTIMYRVAPR